jgi:hypothetical protein
MGSLNFNKLEEGLLNRLFNDIFEGNEFVNSFMFEIVLHVYMVCNCRLASTMVVDSKK